MDRFEHMADLSSEIIETQGIKIPFDPRVITPKIERPMRNNRYEGGECAALRAHLRSGDRVLEFGSGIGLLSTVAAVTKGVEAVTTVEANPDLIPVIAETHRINGAQNVTLLNGVISGDGQGEMNFYLRPDFWASSMEPDSRPYERVVSVPAFDIHALIAEKNPTVVVSDIEGAELGLFDKVDLSGVRVMILEFHPKVYGETNLNAIIGLLATKGLHLVPIDKPSTVRTFQRQEVVQEVVVQAPTFKPDLSHLTDKPWNAALATNDPRFQPIALAYTPFLSEFAAADFYISMDVDEFINIRSGQGHMTDLLRATGPFDVLSMSELNHGSNDIEAYEPGLMLEQFPRHQREAPGKFRSRRGVKSIVRLGRNLQTIRNHRPDMKPGDVTWLDGSGRALTSLHADDTENGIDVRGTYELVSLDHYALRSIGSYLVKMARGDVVVEGKSVSRRYWRQRDRNSDLTSTFERQWPAFKALHDELSDDVELARLHKQSCDWHSARIKELMQISDFKDRRDWIVNNIWAEKRAKEAAS